MSNWDLMMPGMGLTAIGLAGVTVSYAGIAHTFIDGMHALTGLTMFIGLIFLATGILDGGVSTSNRAKATVLVIAAISLSFGTAALMFNTISTIPLFASLMIILAIPAIVISYVATKMPEYTRPIGLIFVLAAVAGVSAYVAFGLVGPDTYLIDEPVIEEAEEPALDPSVPVLAISILAGSDQQGNPDYEPDAAVVPAGSAVEWSNDDVAAHTVTSKPSGEEFDSSLMSAGDTFALGPGSLDAGTYEYFCIVHPWMEATIQIE